jgi:hypothetical protein
MGFHCRMKNFLFVIITFSFFNFYETFIHTVHTFALVLQYLLSILEGCEMTHSAAKSLLGIKLSLVSGVVYPMLLLLKGLSYQFGGGGAHGRTAECFGEEPLNFFYCAVDLCFKKFKSVARQH